MKHLRRLLLPIALLTLWTGIIAAPVAASAIEVFKNCTQTTSGAELKQCRDCATGATATDLCKEAGGSTGNPIIHIITVAINIVSFLAGAAAIIGIIVSGLRMVISNGDSNAVAQARTGIIYSMIGVVVVVLAQSIVVFVLNKIK